METEIEQIEALIKQGRYLEAKALAQTAMEKSDEVRFRQLYALSLSKSGVPMLAQDILAGIYFEHPENAETAGILGSVYKELFKRTEESRYAVLSRDTYLKNFSLTGSYYTGVNAATMSAIAGQARKGREIAKEVIEKIGASDGFWELATLGEAHLLCKEHDKAIGYFLQARKLAGADWGMINSVYNQLWLLNHYTHVPKDVLSVFSPPAVMAFVGHMIDHSDRTVPRFPASIEAQVKESIRSVVRSQKAAIGYGSLACGGDILFAEVVAEEGGEVNIFLPFQKDDFIKTSVAFAGEEWVNRFERLYARFPVTQLTEEPYEDHADLFSMQSRMVFGSAILRSKMLHTEPYLLTLLSELDRSTQEGGTRDNISLWPDPSRKLNINPDNFVPRDQRGGLQPPPTRLIPATARPALYMMWIDFVPANREWLAGLVQAIKESEDIVVAPLVMQLFDDELVVGFTGLRPLQDFVQFVRHLTEEHRDFLRLSIHSGPVYLDDPAEKETIKFRSLRGRHVDIAHQLHQFSSAGTMISAQQVSAEMALFDKEIEFLSVVELEDGNKYELYQINQ